MVKLEDDLRKKIEWIMNTARGRPASSADASDEGMLKASEVPAELLETELPGFEMTYRELEEAVEKYRSWLSEINDSIQDKEHDIQFLTEEFENLTGEQREQVAFDLQIANDDYEAYQEERDEVRAKYQILRRKKAELEREIRRELREQDAVDWESYDSKEARERKREKRKSREKQLQGVRQAQRDTERGVDTEKPDMSAVKEVAGEEKAQQIQESITSEIEFENDWLEDETDVQENRDIQELL